MHLGLSLATVRGITAAYWATRAYTTPHLVQGQGQGWIYGWMASLLLTLQSELSDMAGLVRVLLGRVANFNRPAGRPAGQPAGFFINFGRPKLAKIKNVEKIRGFPSYLDALRDN